MSQKKWKFNRNENYIRHPGPRFRKGKLAGVHFEASRWIAAFAAMTAEE